MPKFISPYAAPDNSLGQSLEALGNSMWGPQAAAAEFNKQKASGARRNNVSSEALQNALRANGGTLDASNPEVAAAVAGLDDPRKFFQGWQGLAANRYGATDSRTSNAQVGAGEAIGATQAGLGQTLASQQMIARIQAQKTLDAAKYTADSTPVNVLTPEGPKIVSRSAAIASGMQPVLGNAEATGVLKMRGFESGYQGYNPAQERAAGVEPPPESVRNYVAPGPAPGRPMTGRTIDGRTDMATGQPLDPRAQIVSAGNAGGTKAFSDPMAPDAKMMGDLRNKVVANKQLEDLTTHAMGLVAKDPTIVGAPGVAQKIGQNAITAARDVANYLGKGQSLQESVANVQQEAATKLGPNAMALLPELYKPDISELEAVHAIIVYRGAEALFGQSGRDLSDRDVAGARAMVGDPSSLFESSKAFMEKMNTINKMARAQRLNSEAILNGGNVSAAPSIAPAPAPAAAAPPPVSADNVPTATGPNGQKLFLRNGAWSTQ